MYYHKPRESPMYRTGVYFGRFLPPHRGHLYQMIEASTRCEKLLVVISDNADQTREICLGTAFPKSPTACASSGFPSRFRTLPTLVYGYWTRQDIPAYPQGWELWSRRMREVVGEPIDAFFVGDMEYGETLARYFPESKVVLFDPARTRYPNISATDIRSDILGNWDYILGAARFPSSPKGAPSPARCKLRKGHAADQAPGQAVQYFLVRGKQGADDARDFLGNDETVCTRRGFQPHRA